LNALDLKIQSAAIKINNNDKLMTASDVIFHSESETVTLVFEKACNEGEAELFLEFSGELNDKMKVRGKINFKEFNYMSIEVVFHFKGFYRSKYTTKSGEDRYAGVTQFEATDARRCFPCWDEPALKATFDLVLVVPTNRVALSNMPVKDETVDGDLKTLVFERTPIMSTYLVAVVVGEYDYVEGKSDDGVLVRVFTPLGKKEQGLFALEVATKVLPYYKDYFNIAYPLPKMDLIAISDFLAGAMENWGLVT
jgi:puromycin-sensitive aminopeptidase